MNNIIGSETLNQLQLYIRDLEQRFEQRDDIAHADIQIYLEQSRQECYYYLVNNTPDFHTVFSLDYYSPPANIYTVEDRSEILF